MDTPNIESAINRSTARPMASTIASEYIKPRRWKPKMTDNKFAGL
jgi:hypothetical protein